MAFSERQIETAIVREPGNFARAPLDFALQGSAFGQSYTPGNLSRTVCLSIRPASMSQDTPSSDAVSATTSKQADEPESVFLVSYPKIVYLYPTVLAALFCGIFMWAKGGIPPEEIRVAVMQGNVVAEMQPSVQFATAAIGAADETETTAEPAESATSESGTNSETQQNTESETTDAAATSDVPADPAANPGAGGDADTHTYHNVCARFFLLVLAMNLVVIAFDFPRTTSLTWFFAIVSIVIGLWFVLKLNPWLAPQIVDALLKIKPAANASFYLIFSGVMIFLYICVLISRRFDYWEVKGNELLHHHGFLSNLERFSAPNLRIDKEINDVFEYLLLHSGRLIIHASNERRAIVLENVLFINQKEERITRMLGALQVRVRAERD